MQIDHVLFIVLMFFKSCYIIHIPHNYHIQNIPHNYICKFSNSFHLTFSYQIYFIACLTCFLVVIKNVRHFFRVVDYLNMKFPDSFALSAKAVQYIIKNLADSLSRNNPYLFLLPFIRRFLRPCFKLTFNQTASSDVLSFQTEQTSRYIRFFLAASFTDSAIVSCRLLKRDSSSPAFLLHR